MNNYEILDDLIIQETLDVHVVPADSKKIARTVLLLAFCFVIFSAFCVVATMEALNKGDVLFLTAASCTQLGTIFLAFRLFVYQYHVRKGNDWNSIFNAKYKVWRALAIAFGLCLSSIALLVVAVNF